MLAILLAEEVAEVALATQGKWMTIWTESDLMTKIVLTVTFLFSVTSWAVIFMKQQQLKAIRKKSDKFLTTFWQSKTLDSLIQKGHFIKSPIFRIFKSAIASLKEQEKPTKDRVSYAIRKAAEDEIENLESYTPFLATTATAAPLLGLFGTVWGILDAFWRLRSSGGATSLEAFGPGIGEALSTTVFGLIAAIPAVIFYNIFTNKIHLITRDLNQFAGDILNRVEDEYLK